MTTDLTLHRVYRTLAPDRVESGAGSFAQLPGILKKIGGRRPIIACSTSITSRTPLVNQANEMPDMAIKAVFNSCRQHSPEDDINRLIATLEKTDCDAVVSIGGSSVFDTVKIAVSRHAGPNNEPISQIAVPTTLSAGEFTPGAGFTENKTGSKQLVLDPRVTPACVVLDPQVTVYTPRELWLSTGMKALDHAIEAIWSLKPHPYVDALALEAIRLLFANLAPSADGNDLNARGACQLGAWMSIAGVGASGMRLSHFLGHQIGARMHIPHGITSCILLPAVMRHLRDDTIDAQLRIARAMGVADGARGAVAIVDEAADRLEELVIALGLPASISAAGGTISDIDAVAVNSMEAAKVLGLTHDLPDGAKTVKDILMSAWGNQ